MKMTFGKKILVGFVTCTAILAAVAFFSFRNNESFVKATELVAHTHEVMYEFDLVLAASVDAESAVRGYVITGNEQFLTPYISSFTSVRDHLARAKLLTADNPRQQENIALLHQQLELRRKNLDMAIDLRQQNFEKARAHISSAGGKDIQDEIRRIITDARNIETNLLATRKMLSDKDARSFNFVFISLIVVIALILTAVYFVIASNLKALREAEKKSAERNWVLTGSFQLNEKIRGEKNINELSQAVIEQLCSYLDAKIGIMHVYENGLLHPKGYFAFHQENKKAINLGDGLAGQAALEKKPIFFKGVPPDYFQISSGLGKTPPTNIISFPFLMGDEIKAVIEMGATREFSKLDLELLTLTSETAAIALHTAQSRAKLKELLEEAQRLSEELEAQQEELKQFNEELQEKTGMLEKSENELKTQQEELQQINEELEEKANLLEQQKEKLEQANIEIENKAKELETTSKYKSEFLANMSHELRTPLNSILILSQLLYENKENRLTEKEVEFARNIHNSGNDQLQLINEILDLSKVESGKIELEIVEVSIAEIVKDVRAMFGEVAKNKSVGFFLRSNDTDMVVLTTDHQRLQQILRNLLSNAFKFTEAGGSVTLDIHRAGAGVLEGGGRSAGKPDLIAFAVTDTGIGIPEDKQAVVFDAFQQADGSTKRKYGGTGLGLSISRELAHALGGDILLQSAEGAGSTFTLYIPQHFEGSRALASQRVVEIKKISETHLRKTEEKFPSAEGELSDDRHSLRENDKVILIMEDDPAFASVLLDFVRERNYKGIVAVQGNTGLSYARYYRPDAIILDMKLPVMNGAEVLKYLKKDPALRHVPVQIISGFDTKKEGMELGAFDFIQKPVLKDDLQGAFDRIEEFVSKKLKKLLIVEDNEQQNKAIRELIGNGDVKSFSAFSGGEAYEMLSRDRFDCIIVDLGLPDMSGFDLLEKIKDNEELNKIPIIVYTGRDLSKAENNRLLKYANTVVLKTADSHERLLDETMLFLHRVEAKLPKEKQRIIRKLHKSDEVLQDKKVLVVDDDMRNIYSLTNVLEEEGMQCLIAENGRKAIEMLKADRDIEIVLMDVMMPEMDGYEATRAIRAMQGLEKLPVIALTAKAVKGDREKCLAAGMSDYVSKPVDIEQLLSLMRVWLYK
jgi:CheY-like chemotaxis protein